jgi:ABC-2 type transport system permease protein
MRWISLFRKCFREQKRDLWMLGLSLSFAPLFVIIYYIMTGGTGSTSYNVLVVDQDMPVSSQGATLSSGKDLVEGLKTLTYKNGSPLLNVILIPDRAAAETRLRDRQAAMLLIIPTDFSSTLSRYQSGQTAATANLTFVGDLTNPTYTIAAVMVMTAADSFTNAVTQVPRPVKLVEIPLGASAARTEFENYIPGLLVMAVVLMIFQAAMTPARDIESGALRRLRLTPMSAFEYLGGTSLWMALVSIFSVCLTFAVAVALGFRSQGPIGLAILVDVIASLSIIGTGLIVACFSKTASQAFVIANFPLGFLMFLTGAAFPLPRPILFTIFGHGFSYADVLPASHAVIALNKIFTLGASLGDIAFELSALVLLTAVYFGVGVWLFQRTQMCRE